METTKEEARYLQDKATLENNNVDLATEQDLQLLNVLPENYLKWYSKKENITDKEKYIKWGQFGPFVLIDDLIEGEFNLNEIKTIYGKRGEDVWFYDKLSGLWNCNGREIIKSRCEELLKNYSKNAVIGEIFEKIKRLTVTEKDEFFNNNNFSQLICLQNGVLDVIGRKLKPFSPEYNFRTKQNIIYNKDCDCTNIKKFISETFYESDIPVIQEWIGFNEYKKHFIKKAMILFGPKNTGKTVFLNLLIRFIGEKNKTGISLHSISKGDKFTLSFLKDKLANIYDDLSFNDLKDAGGFKIATGGGYVTAEYKFGDTFEFLNYAKNTFATNKIPVIDGENDDAYYLRWLPIPCDNEISRDEQDNFLIDKLTTSEELSGLLNWALDGLDRLLKNGRFSYNKEVNEIKNLMEKHSNHLAAFVQDCLMESEGGRITKDQMYELYTIYAKQENLQRLTKTQLGRSLEKFAKYVVPKRDNERFWENVVPNPKKYDTLDAFQKTMSKVHINQHIDMIILEASKVSEGLDIKEEKID